MTLHHAAMTESIRSHLPKRKEKAGAAFERLAAAVQAKLDPGAEVHWNERIKRRQIDVAIRGRLGTTSVFVIVECREYAKRLGVAHVDRLESVRQRVGANKAILVTSVGFCREALRQASEVGIDTCVLRPSESDDYPGPYKPLQAISMTVRLIGTNIRNLEVELVDGRRFPCGLFYRLEDQNGK